MLSVLSNDTQFVLYLVAVILAGAAAVYAFATKSYEIAMLAGSFFFVALVFCLNTR